MASPADDDGTDTRCVPMTMVHWVGKRWTAAEIRDRSEALSSPPTANPPSVVPGAVLVADGTTTRVTTAAAANAVTAATAIATPRLAGRRLFRLRASVVVVAVTDVISCSQ
jgi:hypothetical protein